MNQKKHAKKSRIKSFICKSWEKISLGALIALISISHSLYVYKTYQFPQWDQYVYLQYSVDILKVLKHPSIDFWPRIIEITQHRQPLYPFFISLPMLIFGTEYAYKIGLLVNGLFYITTIIAIYFLSRQFLSKLSSFLASYMFTFYGFPLFYLHFTYQETAATSFVILILLFLAKAIKSPSFKNTFFFSLFVALGTLTRWVIPIFFIGPFLFEIFIFFNKNFLLYKQKFKIIFKHFIIFIFIGIIPSALLYYFPNSSSFKEYININYSQGSNWIDAPFKNPLSKSSFIWYANILAQQTIFFWLLFISGLIVSTIRFKKYVFLILSFTIPYLFFTLGSAWKDDRFIVPLYPIMAIISAVVIEEIKIKHLKKLIILFILTLGFLNFLGASWGIGPMKFSIKGNSSTVPHSVLIPMPIGHPRRVWFAPISWPPQPNEGNVPLILKTITEDFDYSGNKKPTVLLTFDFPQVGDPIATKASIENPSLLTFSQLYAIEDFETLFSKIKNADYLLIKTGRIYDEPRKGQKVVQAIQFFNDILKRNDNNPPTAFKPIKNIIVPIDKSKLTIYRKTKQMTNEEWNEFVNKVPNRLPLFKSYKILKKNNNKKEIDKIS